jgi:hypothetical protein
MIGSVTGDEKLMVFVTPDPERAISSAAVGALSTTEFPVYGAGIPSVQ